MHNSIGDELAPRVAAEAVRAEDGARVPGDLFAPVAGCSRFVALFIDLVLIWRSGICQAASGTERANL